MTETIITIFAIIALIAILALVFFCAVKPHLGIASVLYFVVGIALIPCFIFMWQDGQIDNVQLVVACVMDGAFFIGGIISRIKYLKVRGTDKENEANKEWQERSIRGGLSRLPKNIRR